MDYCGGKSIVGKALTNIKNIKRRLQFPSPIVYPKITRKNIFFEY